MSCERFHYNFFNVKYNVSPLKPVIIQVSKTREIFELIIHYRLN